MVGILLEDHPLRKNHTAVNNSIKIRSELKATVEARQVNFTAKEKPTRLHKIRLAAKTTLALLPATFSSSSYCSYTKRHDRRKSDWNTSIPSSYSLLYQIVSFISHGAFWSTTRLCLQCLLLRLPQRLSHRWPNR